MDASVQHDGETGSSGGTARNADSEGGDGGGSRDAGAHLGRAGSSVSSSESNTKSALRETPEYENGSAAALEKSRSSASPPLPLSTQKQQQDDDAEDEHHHTSKQRRNARLHATVHSISDRLRSQSNLLPSPPSRVTRWASWFAKLCSEELNFYRIHLTVFTFTPLIFSAILYASNTVPVSYIDCLFVSVSAMTVTGLTTINISILSDWQQAILFFLICIGNLGSVSIMMVLIRRHFFRVKFEDIIRKSAKARKRMNDVEFAQQTEKRKQLIRLQRMVGLRKRHNKHGNEPDDPRDSHSGSPHTPGTPYSPRSSGSTDEIAEAEVRAAREQAKKKDKIKKKPHHGPLRADMIRRMDQPAVLINPTGNISHKVPEAEQEQVSTAIVKDAYHDQSGGILSGSTDTGNGNGNNSVDQANVPNVRIAEPATSPSEIRRTSNPIRTSSPEHMNEDELNAIRMAVPARARRHSLPPQNFRNEEGQDDPEFTSAVVDCEEHDDSSVQLSGTHETVPHGLRFQRHERNGSDTPAPRQANRADMFPRAQTIEFADPPRPHHHDAFGARSTAVAHSPAAGATFAGDPTIRYRAPHSAGTQTAFERTPTMATTRSGTYRRGTGVPMTRTQTTSKRSGFGGFPTPFEIAGSVIQRALPRVQQQFERSTTMGRTATFASGASGVYSMDGENVRHAPYLSFDAFVSRNSRFHELTEAQRDELGGVEYRAIDLLAKLLPIYLLGLILLFIVIVMPMLYSSPGRPVRDVLASQGVNQPAVAWMWCFQVMSAYTNTGLSLIDTSMTQLPTQYMMLVPMAILILAGNTAYPIFLRFFIWVLSHCVPKTSRIYETLRFLLDHPRRCFVYLFPSAQTWFLLFVLFTLNCTDWIFFQILDLGNATIQSWSVGQRIFDGLFQSIAVRAAGFQIISLLELAPAVQFLYIVMMYISAYPIAMSVRNTNVYEEKSLGVYKDDAQTDGAAEPDGSGSPRIWGNYLAAHARRQLAFDIWWLGFALWLVCIIEKNNIEDPDSNGWFTVFSCLFELTSAYGTVGLSTGSPNDNFSLSGRFSTLSKLVVIAVMLRGRHRGLPVAIDRAVMLPDEVKLEDETPDPRGFSYDEDGMPRARSFYSTQSGGVGGAGAMDDADPSGPNAEGGLVSSTSAYFPRTATGVSFSGASHMTRFLSRDKTMMNSYEMDEVARGGPSSHKHERQRSWDEHDEKRSDSGHSASHGTFSHPQQQQQQQQQQQPGRQRPIHPRHLTAITEAAYTPTRTPTPDGERNEDEAGEGARGRQHQRQQQAEFVAGPPSTQAQQPPSAPSSESSAGSAGSHKGKARASASASAPAPAAHDPSSAPLPSLRLARSASAEHEERLAARYGCPSDAAPLTSP